MKNKVMFLFLISILLAAIIYPTALFAQNEMVAAQFSKENGKLIGKVFLNNIFICKFYSEEENNLKLKINNIVIRLEKLVSDSVPADEIKCVLGTKEAIIKTDKDILFTVNGKELGVDDYSYFNTAKEYAENLKTALGTLPDIKFSENIIVIQRGKSARIQITGLTDDKYTLEKYNGSVISIGAKTENFIEINGLACGDTKINFIYPPVKKQIIVIVRESAGNIPDSIRVVVTGNPAPAAIVKAAVQANLMNKIEAKHRVNVNINKNSINSLGAIYSYKSKVINIPVTLSGPGFIKASKSVYVQIENTPIALNRTTYLFASDRPETIVNNGKLFDGQIRDLGAHRLLFHHKCYEYSNKRKLEIRLINDTDESSFVYIIKGYALDSNELYAGFYGGENFFRALLARNGYVVEVMPHTYSNVIETSLNPGEIVGGLVNFQVIKGSLPKVIVQSSTYKHSNYQNRELSEGKLVHPRGTFADPDLKLSYEHYLGEEYAFIDIGAAPFLKEIDGGEPCYGNYGAFYNVDISLINDKDYEKECQILLQARAGPARAVLLLDGKLVVLSETIRFPNEVLLGKYKIRAGQTKKVNIITFPMGGINYPVLILVKSFNDH